MTTILFVPGAWIAKDFSEPFLQVVTVAGYERHASYPSSDPRIRLTLTAALRPLVENEGKYVFLFMHSYAGMPGAPAATGLAKSQRAQERKVGGVIGLLALGGFRCARRPKLYWASRWELAVLDSARSGKRSRSPLP